MDVSSSPVEDEQAASTKASDREDATRAVPEHPVSAAAEVRTRKPGAWHQSTTVSRHSRDHIRSVGGAVSDKPRIGFVGLGIMGTPMSGHLVDAGYAVDRVRHRPRHVRRTGAGQAGGDGRHRPPPSWRHAPTSCSRCSPTATSCARSRSVTTAWCTASRPGRCSSTPRRRSRGSRPRPPQALAAAGVAMVDAPVSGAQWGAQAAELVFMVGGASDDVARARPMLDVLGRAVFHLGPLGSGHMMKCINNTVTAMTFQATLEGLALGVAAGLDPAAMNDVFNESTAGSWITAQPHRPADPVAHVRRSVPAGADAQGRRHRQRPRRATRPRPADGERCAQTATAKPTRSSARAAA